MMGYKITRLKGGKYWLKIGERIFIIKDLGYYPPEQSIIWEAYTADTDELVAHAKSKKALLKILLGANS